MLKALGPMILFIRSQEPFTSPAWEAGRSMNSSSTLPGFCTSQPAAKMAPTSVATMIGARRARPRSFRISLFLMILASPRSEGDSEGGVQRALGRNPLADLGNAARARIATPLRLVVPEHVAPNQREGRALHPVGEREVHRERRADRVDPELVPGHLVGGTGAVDAAAHPDRGRVVLDAVVDGGIDVPRHAERRDHVTPDRNRVAAQPRTSAAPVAAHRE